VSWMKRVLSVEDCLLRPKLPFSISWPGRSASLVYIRAWVLVRTSVLLTWLADCRTTAWSCIALCCLGMPLSLAVSYTLFGWKDGVGCSLFRSLLQAFLYQGFKLNFKQGSTSASRSLPTRCMYALCQVVPCLPFPRSFVVTLTELSHFQILVPASCLQHVRLVLLYWLHARTLHCTAPAALCLKPIAQVTQRKLSTIWPAHEVHHGYGYAPTLAVRQGRFFRRFSAL
jgi:hypothetical protein